MKTPKTIKQAKIPNIFSAKLWMLLALATLVLRFIVGFFPHFVETVYSRGLFLGIRLGFDYTIAKLPSKWLIPADFLLIALLLWLCAVIFFFFKGKNSFNLKQRLFKVLLRIGGLLSFILVLFFWLWGFNYSRVPIEEKIGIEPVIPDSLTILKELDITIKAALQERRLLEPTDSIPLNATDFHRAMDPDALRKHLESTLKQEGYSTLGRVNIRTLGPGQLLHFGIAGIYLPFIGEGHVDGGLHPITRPFTVLHEMAHGYGFGDEGSCNFWAYLACIHSNNTAIAYSGHMGYLRYLLGTLRRFGDQTDYEAYRQCLPEPLIVDLDDIRRVHDQYPDWISAAPVNDLYLKAQGVEDGIENYSRIVVLVASQRNAQ